MRRFRLRGKKTKRTAQDKQFVAGLLVEKKSKAIIKERSHDAFSRPMDRAEFISHMRRTRGKKTAWSKA